MKNAINRRTFLKQATAAGIGLGIVGKVPAVFGCGAPNERIVVGVMGVNGRGKVLAESFAKAEGSAVAYICDVDSRAIGETIGAVNELNPEKSPDGVIDFRRILDDQSVDALVIAAPDHWHAPASLLAMQAGKHVYVEKPCGHNPREGEMLVEAQAYHGKVVQMGNQQRSAPASIEIVQAISEGLIGRPYFARSWYANTRGSIGKGQPASVPDWLDYDLWQGPAPHTPYRDNVVHYNWHWFWNWGTGEICNNGTHEIDICRWALGVDYPIRVASAGGRYHFDDDWEMYDTQVASFDFEGGKTITWEGRSCNGRPIEGRGRGSSIHGEKGTVIIDRDGYVVYDHENKEIKRRMRGGEASLDTRGGGSLTDLHIDNFLNTIRGTDTLTAPIDEGHTSVLLCHLGNIAQRTGHTLTCDPTNGHVIGNPDAMAHWGRTYEPGWEPKI